MDIFLLILGFIFALLGIIGSFLPVLPGPLTSWLGLLILHLTSVVPMNWTFLGITLGIAVVIWIIDYFIPAMGTKKFGGTRYGVIGTMVGLIIGILFLGPFGIIIGPFVGAYIGEMIQEKNSGKALKAAFGSFIGFLTSSFLKFIAATIFTGLFISIFWEYKAAFFSFN
ncbi:probable membrane protein NMA1128 [hydrothermal vent metagenome]|uniref:Probable membrane protein NMA1128 n=1 Tax=hydrothermal vent metagenome TaxID=652676 RepID=A0A3B0U2U5_9ZZZZ